MIRSFEQYLARYFPDEVERQRLAALTPEQWGEELARRILARTVEEQS